MNTNQEDNKQSFKILKQIDGHYGENVKQKKPKTMNQNSNKNFKNYSIEDLLEIEND